jgi:hypothetical protein
MLHYGIQYVRGGSYCDTELPEYLLKTLSTEFETTHNYGIEIQNKYNEIVKCNKVKNSADQLQKRLDDYIQFKETYHSIKSSTDVYEINRNMLSELEWAFEQLRFSHRLRNDLSNFEKDNGVCFHKKHIMETLTFFEWDGVNKDRYQKVLDYIYFLKKGYNKLNQENAFETDIHSIHSKSMYDIKGSSYENEIQNTKYLAYYMLNRIEEMEFDLVTTPKGMVQDIKNKIYYLQKMTNLTSVQ